MDQDTADLVAQLCTRVGILMEDTSVVALTLGAVDESELSEMIERLQLAAGKIGHLLAAAQALLPE